jgi:glycine cleavage system H protein
MPTEHPTDLLFHPEHDWARVDGPDAVFAPLSGEIVAVNEPAAEAPDLINTSPYDAGWLVRVRLADVREAEQLLGAAAYAALLDESA